VVQMSEQNTAYQLAAPTKGPNGYRGGRLPELRIVTPKFDDSLDAEITRWNEFAEHVGFDAAPLTAALKDGRTLHWQGSTIYAGLFHPDHFTEDGRLKRYAMELVEHRINIPAKRV